MKVLTLLGTRPELIRLARVISLLDETVDQHVLVHTGQNYDHGLNQVFFDELGLRSPDHYLGAGSESLAGFLATTLTGVEQVLVAERPDAVLVLGDTNSSLGALIAKRMGIPVYHMEAGNRSFDENVPEEINRRVIDHLADFNLVYTEHARRNLLAEGLHPRRIMLTGSPMGEVLDFYAPRIEQSTILDTLRLEPQGFYLVSAHREENVDSVDRLTALLTSLQTLRQSADAPRVVVSTHPRTRKRLDTLGSPQLLEGIEFLTPFGFFDYCALQKNARCVLSDSGTISEESAIMGFPAVTIRDSMERPEALDAGTILMSGLEPHGVVRCVEAALRHAANANRSIPAEYRVLDVSVRTVGFILSTADRHAFWAGLHTR